MAKSEPQNRRLGYARVSTYGQTLDAQLAQLRAEGCARIYREKASGAQADRRELQRMLRSVAPGDVVTVTRIDRLARSTFEGGQVGHEPFAIDAGYPAQVPLCHNPLSDGRALGAPLHAFGRPAHR